MSETYQFSTLNGVPPFNGIKFPATQVPSADPNTLDDYEEGTWTPIIGGDTETGQTYIQQIGTYIKIGQVVVLYAKVKLSNKGTITGIYTKIKGLPFSMSPIGGGSGYTVGIGGVLGFDIRANTYMMASKNGTSDSLTSEITNSSELVFTVTCRAL